MAWGYRSLLSRTASVYKIEISEHLLVAMLEVSCPSWSNFLFLSFAIMCTCSYGKLCILLKTQYSTTEINVVAIAISNTESSEVDLGKLFRNNLRIGAM